MTAACGIPTLGTNPKKHGPLAETVPGNTFGMPGRKDKSNAPTTSLSPMFCIEEVCAIYPKKSLNLSVNESMAPKKPPCILSV